MVLGKMKRLSEKKNDFIFYLCILIVSIIFFTLVGEKGYYEYPDSWQYIGLDGGQGIMPVYPLFIQFHRMIFENDNYLYGVVASQTIITITCLMIYMIWIVRRFRPGYVILSLIYLTALIPFTLDFPVVIGNHSILTEALTYPLFYLFAISFVEAMIQKKQRWVCINFALGIGLALIRTQMQLCLAYTALVFLYIILRKSSGKKVIRKIIRIFTALIICVGIVLVGELAVLRINGRLQNVIEEIQRESTVQIVQIENMELVAMNNLHVSALAQGNNNLNTVKAARVSDGISTNSGNMTGQFDSVLVDRTFYEMDEEDVELFEDPEVRSLFEEYFKHADQAKARYVYARKGLWKWKDIMNGTAAGTICMNNGRLAYLEKNPDSAINDVAYWKQLNRQIAYALLREHWPRMLYHTLCMLPQGFICTVFFQKETIYGLCHFYTFLIYFSAVILSVFTFVKKDFPETRKEFMLGILFINIGMVIVISVVFFGMQRYLIYGFGIFYAAFLLILEQLWEDCGRKLWEKVRSRF